MAIGKAFLDIFRIEELRKKALFTIIVLLVFRLGVIVPIPGIDVGAARMQFSTARAAGGGMGITEYLNFFTGGAFQNFSVFMLGVMPYITMSIIMQVMMIAFPALKRISEEEGGRKRIQRYTRLGTVAICILQSSLAISFARENDIILSGIPMWSFISIAVFSITVGSLLLMWMGEQITARGIGNGISLIIFTGIVARMPDAIAILGGEMNAGRLNPVFVIIVFFMYLAIIILVIYEQQGQRKIPVHYAKRIVGRKMYAGQSTYIPFKINPSGVIPIIFANAVLTFPTQIVGYLGETARSNSFWVGFSQFMRPHGVFYMVVYTLLIVLFAYFYTQVSLNPIEVARQIRENGGTIPGIRTENLEAYLTKILNRIILPGALFLAAIALIPSIVIIIFGFPETVAYLMGGTSLLIMIGVELDTMSQVESQLKMHFHDGFAKSGKLRTRNL